ncbi:MAG: PorT family protein [Acidimicrobiia bacterium]|nr:PorT family protein [Acidimicrobiia bacterium]
MTPRLGRIRLALPLAVLLATVASTVNAQNAEGIGVGLKGGLLFSSLDFGRNDDLIQNRTGLIGGLFIGGNRGGLIGVEADILYARKGSRLPTNRDLDIHMLEIPVLLRVNAGSRSLSGIGVYGLAGPAMDFRLKSEFNGVDIIDFTEGYDVNLVFGGGIEITRFLAEVRYNRGLRNISKNFSASNEIKTRAWALLIGVRFN